MLTLIPRSCVNLSLRHWAAGTNCRRPLRKVARWSSAPTTMDLHQKKLWIDCDLGVDDAVALMLSLSDPSTKVLAVSSVFGNADAQQVANNTRRVLSLCDRSQSVPVYVGANEPLIRPKPENPKWHGSDGLGDRPQAKPRESDVWQPAGGAAAAVKLVECAAENEGRLTVCALGPLTNIALALKLDPLLPSRLGQLVIMGSGGENVSSGVEFNFGSDPEAAKLVFDKFSASAVSSLVLVGLDVCENKANRLPWHIWDSLLERETQKARFLAAITEQSTASAKSSSPEGWALADPVAMAVALQPELVTSAKQVNVEVEVMGSKLVAGLALLSERGACRIKLVTSIDRQAFISMCIRSLE